MKGKGILVSTGLILLVATSMAWADDEPSCVQAARWVEAHADQLPSTYEEITAYPVAHRRAIFAALPAPAKSQVWRQHLDRWTESHPDLSADQSALIKEARAFLDSDLFEVMDDPARYQAHVDRLRDFEEKALDVMTADEVSSAFVDLGSLRPAAYQIDDIKPPKKSNCDCAVGTPGLVRACPKGQTCKDGGCTKTPAGCGLFTYIQCHGLCTGADDIEPVEEL